MALPIRVTSVQVPLSTPLPRRLADDRLLCMACLQLYWLALSSLPGQGVFHHSTYCTRRGDHNALARDHGREGTALGCRILSVNCHEISGVGADIVVKSIALRLPQQLREANNF